MPDPTAALMTGIEPAGLDFWMTEVIRQCDHVRHDFGQVGEGAVVAAGDVIKVWKQISQSLSKSQPNLSALLNSVRMIDVQGKALVLGFASNVLVEKMDKPEHADILRKALADVLGVQLDLRCVVTSAKGKLPPNVSQDGMVAAALNQGGEIVDMD